VVGGGLLGLSAAWSLARRDWDVTVLEAGPSIGHARSGSQGDARIFRLGYPEARYVEMALLSRDLWRQLEATSGRRLLHVTGQVTFGDARALASIVEALAARGVPVGELTVEDAASRFAGMAVRAPALLEPESGVLAAGACLRALVETGGFAVRTGARVIGLAPGHGSVAVDVEGDVQGDLDGEPSVRSVGTVRSVRSVCADIVVDCAGPGTLALVGGDHAVGAAPSLPQVAYFRGAHDAADAARLPVFIEWGDDMIYGLPVLGGGAHAATYKVSHHTPGTPLEHYDPAGATPMGDDPALLGALTDAARRLLPALDPEPVATERCLYDNSADGDFVLDRVGDVVVGCGTSGHGFKFGPLLGELLADLADGIEPRVDLSPFRLDRRQAPAR
jgi:sarcosine oxidase